MSTLSLEQRIKGRVVFITKDGKEVPETTPNAKARINGPHHEARWAQDATRTYRTAGQRREHCRKQRENASFAKLWNKSSEASKHIKIAKPQPAQAVIPRGLGKAMKGIKTT